MNDFSRRQVVIAGGVAAALPLLNALPAARPSRGVFPTGDAAIDRALGGGLRPGSLLVVAGPRGGGKTAFLTRLARANGIVDAHAMDRGTSDMLSIMRRGDGQHIGSVLLNGAEPSTDREVADMQREPAARDAFLARWFRRTREVLNDSGGIFALTALAPDAAAAERSAWAAVPDCVVWAEGSAYRLINPAAGAVG